MDQENQKALMKHVNSLVLQIIDNVIGELEREITSHSMTINDYKWVRASILKMAIRSIRAKSVEKINSTLGKELE
jgi:hypothetical protein